MGDAVVTLTSSDSEEDVFVKNGLQSVETDLHYGRRNSDDELMDLDLDSPARDGDNGSDDEICEILLNSEKHKAAQKSCSTTKAISDDCNQRNMATAIQPVRAIEPPVVQINPVPTKSAAAKRGRTKKNDTSKAYEKAVKAAEAANKKANKKADCLKLVTVVIDSQLLNVIPGSGSILLQLQEAEMTNSIVPTFFPKTIHWKREKREFYATEDGQVALRSEFTEEDDGIVVLTAEEFVAEALTTSLVHYLNNIIKKWKKSHLNLVIFGLAAYHKEQSLREKRQFREQATGEKSQRPNGRRNQAEGEPGLSFSEIEQLKIDVMVQTSCSVWPVESSEELGKIIARLTKAVAERPFKEGRLDQQFEFYADDYSGGIKVNKEGHGLERLWQQQLMQFPLVGLETAQAISSRYPSPFSLYKAYSACNDENEASLLLQDIPIRRHAGPLSTARRVGPELSRRVYKFMTSKDGSAIL